MWIELERLPVAALAISESVTKFLPLTKGHDNPTDHQSVKRLLLSFVMADTYHKASKQVITEDDLTTIAPRAIREEAIRILLEKDLLVEEVFNNVRLWKHGKAELNIVIDYHRAKSMKE